MEYGSRLPQKIKAEINNVVLNVLKYAPEKSEFLSGLLKGLRSYHVGRGYRIIFAICGECRERGHTRINHCEGCNTYSDNTVMLFICGPHEVYEEMERIRRLG